MKKVERLLWEVGKATEAGKLPERYYAAAVPGSVQLDVMRAGELPDYRHGEQYRAYDGLEDYYWVYRTRLPQGKNMFLVSGGIDYSYKIYADDCLLYEYEGMQKGFSLDVSAYAGKMLYIKLDPAPKAAGQEGRAQANLSCKPAVNYGWDFQPRLIPLGIWNDCYIEHRGDTYLEESNISYTLSEGLDAAQVTLCYRVKNGGVRFSLNGEIAESSDSEGKLMLTLKNPKLWYPAGYGEPFLYEAKIEALSGGRVCDVLTKKIGFRRVRLVTTPYNWRKVHSPVTQALPPVYPEVNGVKVFAKGTNWVVPDVFYSEMSRGRYETYLRLIRDANMNFVRCWGGCGANKEPFYELCDECGILIWQEFPLACNYYADDPHYLQVLESEARAMLSRIGEHACCALWVGGNELFEGWSGMTQQSRALRMLDKLCLEMCPDIPFLMTSPIMGMIHGSYGYLYAGEEPHLYIRNHPATAYTEFGIPSTSGYDAVRSVVREDEAGKFGGSWETHKGCGAWEAEPESWGYLGLLNTLLPGKDLQERCKNSQILQGILYQSVFEELRSHKDICGMALNWDFDDSWPVVANNSLVEYGGKPKRAYESVKRALKPTVLSLQYGSVYCKEELRFCTRILSDTAVQQGLRAKVIVAQNEKKMEKVMYFPADGEEGESAAFDIHDFECGLFRVSIEAEDASIANEYDLIKRG